MKYVGSKNKLAKYMVPILQYIIDKNNIVIVSENEAPNDWVCIWQQQTKTSMNNRNRINKIEKLFIHKNQLKIIKEY